MEKIYKISIKRREYSAKWRLKKIEDVRRQAREWVERKKQSENGEEFMELCNSRAKRYREKNLEKCREREKEKSRLYRKNNPEKYLQQARDYRKNNPERFKSYYENRKKTSGFTRDKRNGTLRKYGLDVEKYNIMVDGQGGKCAICDNSNDSLVVDHCHETGKVRSLLCNKCNILLGMIESGFKRNENILNLSLEYLKKNEALRD